MTTAIKPAPTVIEFNETGFYSNLDPRIDRITGVYLFDRNSHIHIADPNPSYELIALYPNVYLKDGLDSEDHLSLIEEYESDWRAATNDVDYTYARSVELSIANGARIYTSNMEPEEDESHKDFMERCREAYTGNHML